MKFAGNSDQERLLSRYHDASLNNFSWYPSRFEWDASLFFSVRWTHSKTKQTKLNSKVQCRTHRSKLNRVTKSSKKNPVKFITAQNWTHFQCTQDIKENAFSLDKTCKFSRNPLFQATYNISGFFFIVVFYFYVVRNLKKRTSSKMCTFCPVLSNQKAFSLISCVFWDLFFQNAWQSTLFHIFSVEKKSRH